MTSQPDQYELEVFDSNSMDWLEIPIEQLGRSLRSSCSRRIPTPECPARSCVTTLGSSIHGIRMAARTACLF